MIRFPILAALSLTVAASLGAQQSLPSPSQAAALVQARPDLAAQIRQQIGGSGMTPEQIRTRLRAAGYPENFLDQLMPGSTGRVEVTEDVIGAVARLGIASRDDAELMQTMLRADSSQLAQIAVEVVGAVVCPMEVVREGVLIERVAAGADDLGHFQR